MPKKFKLRSIELELKHIRNKLKKEHAKAPLLRKKRLAAEIKGLNEVIKLIPPICKNPHYDLK
jgi:hypothetical protein